MIESIFWGVLAGLATVLLSEALMLCRANVPVQDFWKLSLVNSAFRSAFVVAALVVGVSIAAVDPAPFTFALSTAYLGGLIFEARRYRRRIETK